ncbi:MAG: sensor domain-containing diguanylate cyclase [Erythrobacter sp.]
MSVIIAIWALLALPAGLLLADGGAHPSLWLGIATIVPMMAIIVRHLMLSFRLDQKNRELSENLTQLQLAEQLAGVGRWSVDIPTRQHRWSEEVCAIVGVPIGTPPGADLLGKLMPDGLRQMETTFYSHRNDREPFVVEFEIENPHSGTRVLRAKARNSHSPEGAREQVFMVVRDVTEEYTRVATAERDRAEALAREEEARRLANTDALTGLPNRRAAMAALDRAIIAARAGRSGLGLIVFDIDHFKRVNDTHGHAVGDRVLAEVGRIAARNCREGQLAARVGGEEFLMILSDASEPAVSGAAERLRLAIEAGTALAPLPGVTVSLGRAMLGPGDTSLTLFARADEALYAAKKGGRNRVALAA